MADSTPIKLNLGGGNKELDGFVTVDRKNGGEIYPLAYDDGSVNEIYASHVLEHFSHRGVTEVLKHWVTKLAPGGRLRVAVPDFEFIARNYLDGEPIDVQGYVMGGHVDADDMHGVVFDYEVLHDLLVSVGLERIGRWTSNNGDCAALPVSLNLEGFKPNGEQRVAEDTIAILSCPRFGPTLHARVASAAFGAAHIPYRIGQGAYWHQVLSELIEEYLDKDLRFIFTVDYDSIFSYHDVMELYRLAEACPEVDAIMPVQSKRAADCALFGMCNADGTPRLTAPKGIFTQNLVQVRTGHFGLTLFRVESLRKLPRPWFLATPNAEGRWTEGRVDADIAFWHNWAKAGLRLYMANRVVIGHMEEVVVWPGQDFKPVTQLISDYAEFGIPKGVERCV